MKICVFETRPDEIKDLTDLSNELGIELVTTSETANMNTISLAEGCQGISILGLYPMDKPLIDVLYDYGVRYISTRTVGYDNVDVKYAYSKGMRVCNAAYDPNGVADYTVMMMLLCIRHYKEAFWRSYVDDFSLAGLQGREMKDMTIGVVGTGRIGLQVLKNLSGFGSRLLAYDPYPSAKAAEYAEYVELEELYRQSDIITLHVPLLKENYHMINSDTMALMKDGVILINCARGELMDNEALITGIETRKIGALGMDTVEGEQGIVHRDHRSEIIANRNMFYLHQFRNVVMTQHMAFYTDAAVRSMVRCSIEGMYKMSLGERYKTEVR